MSSKWKKSRVAPLAGIGEIISASCTGTKEWGRHVLVILERRSFGESTVVLGLEQWTWHPSTYEKLCSDIRKAKYLIMAGMEEEMWGRSKIPISVPCLYARVPSLYSKFRILFPFRSPEAIKAFGNLHLEGHNAFAEVWE